MRNKLITIFSIIGAAAVIAGAVAYVFRVKKDGE